MVSHDVLQIVFLVLGYVFTGVLYVSPIPTIWRIWRAGDVGQYKFDMFIATLASCLVWLMYGLPHPFNKAIVIINAVGIVIEGFYLVTYICISPTENRCTIGTITGVVLAVVGLIAAIVFPLVKNPRTPFGYIGDATSIFMYAGPIRQLIVVWKTKDVQHMSVWVAGASLFSGISWTVYACLISDNFILVPNAVGILFAIVQTVLYLVVKYLYEPAGEAPRQQA